MTKNKPQPEQEPEITEDVDIGGVEQPQEQEEIKEQQNYLEDLQRVQAEFQNYMKRVEKERILLTDFAKRDLLLKMLALQDEFEVALAAFQNAEDKQELVKGVEMLFNHLQKILESEQVRVVESL